MPSSARGPQHVGHLGGGVDPPVERMAGVRPVEAGEPVGAVAQHAHVERLQPLERRAHVEDRLDARAHDEHRRPRQRGEVGRLVPRVARAAVHAAEAAGREDRDPGPGRKMRGGGDGRGAHPAARGHRGDVADADLGDVRVAGDAAERLVVQPDASRAVDDGDGRRHRAAGPHGVLDLAGDPQVVRARQPVADDRALQRDHRAPAASAAATSGWISTPAPYGAGPARPEASPAPATANEISDALIHVAGVKCSHESTCTQMFAPPRDVAGVDQLVGAEPQCPRDERRPARRHVLAEGPTHPRDQEVVDDQDAEQRHEDRADEDEEVLVVADVECQGEDRGDASRRRPRARADPSAAGSSARTRRWNRCRRTTGRVPGPRSRRRRACRAAPP